MGSVQRYVDNLLDQPDPVDAPETEPRRVTMAGIFRIPDQMWERIQPLVPQPEKVHPFRPYGGRASQLSKWSALPAQAAG